MSKSAPHKVVEMDMGDTLMNLVSGLNSSKDRQSYSQHVRSNCLTRDWTQLEALYMENWLAQKVINIVPKDMTREWRKFSSEDLTPEQIEQLEAEERRLQLKRKFREAQSWARLYGGGVLLPVIDGEEGKDLSMPLDWSRLQIGQLKQINVMDARTVHPASVVTLNPFDPNYLLPEYYTLVGAKGSQVHHSRIIRFTGNDIPYYERRLTRYWGQSILEPINKAIKDAVTSSGALASLLHELNLDIISVEGLSSSMAGGREEFVKQRFETYHYLKSIWGIMVLDSKEQYNNRQFATSGMDKIIEKFYDLVAGATDIPVTRLLATSPAGMNATGESDTRNYYDMISCEQEDKFLEPLRLIDQMMALNIWGAIPEKMGFEFLPLWQETAGERAQRELAQAQRDQVYLMNNIITEDIVAKELKQNGTYDNITDEYLEELESAVKEITDEDGLLPKAPNTDESGAPEEGGSDSSSDTSQQNERSEVPQGSQ